LDLEGGGGLAQERRQRVVVLCFREREMIKKKTNNYVKITFIKLMIKKKSIYFILVSLPAFYNLILNYWFQFGLVCHK
jgi:hypothetical protein